MDLKIFFTDLDGTLLRSDDTISAESLKALKRLKKEGIKVAIATGRAKAVSQYVIDEIKPDYFIGLNGAVTTDEIKQKYISKIILNHKTSKAVVKMLDELKLFYLICTHGSLYFPVAFKDDLSRAGMKNFFLGKFQNTFLPINNPDEVESIEAATFFAETNDENTTKIFLDYLKEFADVTSAATREFGYDIISRGVNKGTAVKGLCDTLGIDLKDTAGIGDSENDVAMLQTVGKSIAVENAFEHVKSVADIVVPSNDNNGVAYIVDRILAGKI